MSDELPWLKMLLLLGMLIVLFAGPFVAIKVHDLYLHRRSARDAKASDL